MKSTEREKGFLRGFIEFLLVVIIVLVVAIRVDEENKNKKDDAAVKLPGRYMITLRWPQNPTAYSNEDYDLHAIDPKGSHAWFADTTGGDQSALIMDTVDDTGIPIRFFTNPQTGELQMCGEHEERILIQQTTPGEYIFVVFAYNKRLTNIPIPATVTLIDLEKSSQELIKSVVELSNTGEQKVAFRFSLDQFGNVVVGSINHNSYTIDKTNRYR